MTTELRGGFGVAGSEIISKNMAVEGKDSAILKSKIPGKRFTQYSVFVIFMFSIHAFDSYTEKLEDEIITFINSVARIVHDKITR